MMVYRFKKYEGVAHAKWMYQNANRRDDPALGLSCSEKNSLPEA